MHIYSVPLRSSFAFPCVPWNFEVGNASDQKLEVGALRSPVSYYTLTTASMSLKKCHFYDDILLVQSKI